MKKIWWITTNVIEKIWWNNFWYLYPDINFVIDGTKWDFFRAKDDCSVALKKMKIIPASACIEPSMINQTNCI